MGVSLNFKKQALNFKIHAMIDPSCWFLSTFCIGQIRGSFFLYLSRCFLAFIFWTTAGTKKMCVLLSIVYQSLLKNKWTSVMILLNCDANELQNKFN